MRAARRGLETQLQSLTANTVEFLRREQGLILHGDGLPAAAAPSWRVGPYWSWSPGSTTRRTSGGSQAS